MRRRRYRAGYQPTERKKDREDRVDEYVSSLEQIQRRLNFMKDPVTKNIAWLHFVLDLVDGEVRDLEADCKDIQRLKSRVVKAKKDINQNIRNLLDWIQNPVYGPDYDGGNAMMLAAKQQYEERNREAAADEEKDDG
jgi:hypothetical protein